MSRGMSTFIYTGKMQRKGIGPCHGRDGLDLLFIAVRANAAGKSIWISFVPRLNEIHELKQKSPDHFVWKDSP